MIKVSLPDPFEWYEFDKKALRKGWRKLANTVKRQAKSKVKKARYTSKPGQIPLGKTGELRKSITAKVYKNGSGFVVYPKAPYAFYLAYGHAAPGRAGSGKKVAQPRVSSAFIAGQELANTQLDSALSQMFDEAFKGTKLRIFK